jgi:hypothetical protein
MAGTVCSTASWRSDGSWPPRTRPRSMRCRHPAAHFQQQQRQNRSSYTGITMTPPREFAINVRYSFGSR